MVQFSKYIHFWQLSRLAFTVFFVYRSFRCTPQRPLESSCEHWLLRTVDTVEELRSSAGSMFLDLTLLQLTQADQPSMKLMSNWSLASSSWLTKPRIKSFPCDTRKMVQKRGTPMSTHVFTNWISFLVWSSFELVMIALYFKVVQVKAGSGNTTLLEPLKMFGWKGCKAAKQ